MTVWRSLASDHRNAIGVGILGLMVGLAILAPLVAPVGPTIQGDVLQDRFLAPFAEGADGLRHWLGTDALGRDVLSRLVYGARISLSVGFLSVVLSVLIGTAIGVAAALIGGVPERVLMAVTDTALAMPRLVLLLALVALWEPSTVLVILGLTGWMSIARLARAELKGLLHRPFVDAARATGASGFGVLARHLLPNVLTPIIVAGALAVGNAIMLEAGLSFLGLGIPAPAPSWGNMIASGRDALVNAPWIATLPGLAVALAVVSCSLLGDGLRDALDPRTRG
ncbi:MAG: ABC transporter permease [Gemmatimonadales bacterium]|jgi:peptide/nickel transport system permease protein